MKCGDVWTPRNKKRNRLAYIIIHTYKRHVFYIRQHRHTWARATDESVRHKVQYQIKRVSISRFKKTNQEDYKETTCRDTARYAKLVATMMGEFLESVENAMEI